MTTATFDGEKIPAEEPLAEQNSGKLSGVCTCFCTIIVMMGVPLILSSLKIKDLIKCKTLLPATCQVTNTTKHSRTVTVTPENDDKPFSHVTTMAQHPENGKKVQCFYCNRNFSNILRFDSDQMEISFFDFVFPLLFSIELLVFCSCCCMCRKPTRRDGEERDPEPNDTTKNTSKKSEAGTSNLSDSEYQDSTTLSETSIGWKKSTDGSGSFSV